MSEIRGKFIVIEGGDGSGKTTVASWLRKTLEEKLKVPVNSFRDPGSSVFGEHIRQYLLNESHNPYFSSLCPEAELFAFMTSACQLGHECIKPALSEGHWVIQDRWRQSTFVYQGIAGALENKAGTILKLITDFEVVKPDLCIILQVDPEVAQNRISMKRQDRFESRGVEFYERVYQSYNDLPQVSEEMFTYPIIGVDSNREIEEVQKDVLEAVMELVSGD